MKRNIAFLLRYWPVYGGGETVTIILANEMVRRGHNVYVVYLWDYTRKELPFIDPAIHSIRIAGRNGEKLGIKSSLLTQQLNELVIKEKIDFVINQHWDGATAYRAVNLTDAILIKCHHINVQKGDKSKMPIREVNDAKTFLKWILGYRFRNWCTLHGIDNFYKNSDYLAFLAPSYMEQYKQMTHLHYDKNRLLALFNPLVYNKTLQESEYEKKENIALFVGRICEKQKRLLTLLRIWRRIEDFPSCKDWKLVIVGKGEDLESSSAYAKQLELQRVSFEGYQDPKKYYERSKIFMMTSRNEGLPMTLLEAKQNLMCPIVMNTFLCLSDILTNNVDGLVVGDSEDEFVAAFEELATDHDLLHRLSTNISNTHKFLASNIVDEWEKLFDQATKKNK